tara:strand:+ start:918 stop:1118 length:201 start_codon:yes stop_codon:yes gene_type:complete
MKAQTKSIIIGGLLGGIVYALVMAGFDLINRENFNLWKFIFNFIFFGISMTLMTRYSIKKSKNREK